MSAKEFVDALAKGDNLEAETAFKSVMSDRVGSSLETKRREVAGNFVKNHIPEVEENEEVSSD